MANRYYGCDVSVRTTFNWTWKDCDWRKVAFS